MEPLFESQSISESRCGAVGNSDMTEHKSELELEEEAVSYPGWRVTVASGIGVFVSFGSLLVYTFGIFLKPLTEEFFWSRQAVSLAFGIAAMALAVSSPPLGYLIDRFGPGASSYRALTIFGCAFASLALLTPHIGHLYAIFLVLGLVGNGAAHLAYSRVVSTWFDRRRGMALAVLMAGGALGAIFLPPTAQALIQKLGWRGAFLVLGMMSLALGLPVVARFIRERPRLRGAGRAEVAGLLFKKACAHERSGSLPPSCFGLDQSKRRDDASFCTAHRSWCVSWWCRLRSVRHGRGQSPGRLGTGWFLDRFFAPRVSFWVLAFRRSACSCFPVRGHWLWARWAQL